MGTQSIVKITNIILEVYPKIRDHLYYLRNE